MSDATDLPDLSPDTSHPRAVAALTDAFFWSLDDETAPFGNETAHEVLDAFRDFRDEHPVRSPLELLEALLARWEVEDASWDVVEPAQVQDIGEEDEYGLLTRDEAILALAFGQIVTEGRIHPEVRRRAVLALARQSLPALLHAFGPRARQRAQRIERMTAVLTAPWAS
jgi:uncharacterized protein YfeS